MPFTPPISIIVMMYKLQGMPMKRRKQIVYTGGVVAALVFVLGVLPAMGQLRPAALKIGYLNPKDAQPGLLLGADFTFPVDETVEMGFSANVFYRNYKKLSSVAAPGYSAGINEKTLQQELEYTTLSAPLYAIINILIPMNRYFGYQLHGGLGYEFLFNQENNYLEQKSEKRFYKGMSWLVSAGFHYRIGSRSSITGELLYHSAKVSRSRSETPEGLPIWREVDLSGFGFRFGIRFNEL